MQFAIHFALEKKWSIDNESKLQALLLYSISQPYGGSHTFRASQIYWWMGTELKTCINGPMFIVEFANNLCLRIGRLFITRKAKTIGIDRIAAPRFFQCKISIDCLLSKCENRWPNKFHSNQMFIESITVLISWLHSNAFQIVLVPRTSYVICNQNFYEIVNGARIRMIQLHRASSILLHFGEKRITVDCIK